MAYLKITKWISPTDKPFLHWRSIDEIIDLNENNSTIPQKYFDRDIFIEYITTLSVIKSELNKRVKMYHSVKKDNIMYSVLLFDTIEQKDDFENNFINSENFTLYKIARNRLLTLFETQMIVYPIIEKFIFSLDLLLSTFEDIESWT